MDVIALTRALVDIESLTGNESDIGDFLLQELASRGFGARRMPVEPRRFNVCATIGAVTPPLFLSTHMDTVPPFLPSSEDDDNVYGRGACDAKGIMAAQILAAEELAAGGVPCGLLFVVGEERDSLGAKVANQQSPGCRFLVNGEPTENRLALACKGALRVEITARGRMAHSAYPELGESAIDKLLDALARLRSMALPADPEIGATTLNIGVIEGGRAPNVVSDYARAQLLYRLVGPSEELKRRIQETAGDLAQIDFILEIPCVRLRRIDGLPTMVAAFTTDIPALKNWGEPLLIGPGSIRVAHSEGEYVSKSQLRQAVELYITIAKKLLASGC